MGRPFALGALGALLAITVAGCVSVPASWTETPFARTATDAGSTFSVAAELLDRAHTGSLTNTYVRGAFVNFSDAVADVIVTLPGLEGRPGAEELDRLLEASTTAKAVLDQPCIDAGCDWSAQVAALRAAGVAFAAAADQ